jgi:hypothetical protein
MTKLLYIIFLQVFFLSAYSQVFEYTYAKNIGKESNETIDLFFEIESHFYIVKRVEESKTDFTLDVVDSNFNLLVQNKISLPVTFIKHFGVLNNEMLVFGVNHTGTEDELIGFTLKDLGKSFSEKTLMSCKNNGGYHTAYDVAVSPNGKYCSIIGSEAYNEKLTEKIYSKLLDENLNEIYNKEMLVSLPSAKKRNNVLRCNDNGFSYIVKKDRVKNSNNYYIYTIAKSGEESHADIRLKSRQIVDAEIILNNDGALIICGFYSSPISYNFEGVFFAKYSESSKCEISKEYMLNSNVVETFKSKKEIKESGFGLDYFRASRLSFIDNKNLVLIAEHHSINKDAKNGPEDVRKGIVALNLDDNGGFKYATPYVTDQTDSESKGYWSSFIMVANKGVQTIYLNRIGEGAKSAKGHEQTLTALPIETLTFDKSGNYVSSYQNFNLNLPSYCLNTTFVDKTSKGIICFESLDRKGYTFGVLKPENE